ncbi:hypothetical protein BDA96_07G119800 [Sorghum bicolor]|uniref:Uncharacterized protein n=2 Tax=Sorghum bicolor TaxID=4558 RepID=A0A921QKQ1_SORBI|nr:hypothetical protein BDA96_07G119800 [Sorghum bicolor]KXG25040.1 hypothetical protein SORBI_3007G112700 [Sorghum bicolor]
MKPASPRSKRRLLWDWGARSRLLPLNMGNGGGRGGGNRWLFGGSGVVQHSKDKEELEAYRESTN